MNRVQLRQLYLAALRGESFAAADVCRLAEDCMVLLDFMSEGGHDATHVHEVSDQVAELAASNSELAKQLSEVEQELCTAKETRAEMVSAVVTACGLDIDKINADAKERERRERMAAFKGLGR